MSTKHETIYVAVDVETNSEAIDGILTNLWCISFAQIVNGEVETRGIALDWHIDDDHTEDPYFKSIQLLLEGELFYPVFHHAAFDVWVLREFGFYIPRFHDTQLMSYVSYPDRPSITVQKKRWDAKANLWRTRNQASKHSLASWGVRLGEYKTLIESDFSQFSEEMLNYNKQDARVTIKTFDHLYSKLHGAQAYRCYEKIEVPFVDVLINMRQNGMLIDRARHEEFIKELEVIEQDLYQTMCESVDGEMVEGNLKKYKKRHTELEFKGEGGLNYLGHNEEKNEYIYRKWTPINPGSGKHVGQLLVRQGWKPKEFNKDDNPKVDKAILEVLAPEYEIVKQLLEWRKIHKLTSTYGNSLLEKLRDDDRLYCSWNQSIAITGRLSSSKPNLQNIPSRDERGSQIRKSFVARPGFKIVSIDVSQFQIRILADYLTEYLGDRYSDANVMTKAFNSGTGADPHQAVADLIGIPRKPAKNVNFGEIFGFGAHKLASMINCSLAQARKFIRSQRDAMPSIGHLKQMIWAEARRNHGVVHTLYSRRGIYPAIFSDNNEARSRAERQVFNFVIQGTEADIMKLILVALDPAIKEYFDQVAYLIGQIHDEILFEVAEVAVNEFSQCALTYVEQDWLRHVRMQASVGVADNWLEAH